MADRADGYSLVRFGLNSPDAVRLAGFYEQAFSAVILSREHENCLRDHAAAWRTVLKLGNSILEILQFDEPGAPYPGALSPYDQRFQHLAIVVTAMPLAMQRLSQTSGWTAISTHGPQTLPPSAGNVAAFKFRDPDGHPLEFLQFLSGGIPAHRADTESGILFPGIDHSAISVRGIEPSVRFYSSLGLAQASRTLNAGIEQERLDGIRHPHVDVIGLAPSIPTPHVELLHYRTETPPALPRIAAKDVAATRMVFARAPVAVASRGTLIQDPDGHFIELLD